VVAFNVLNDPSRQALERAVQLAKTHAKEPFGVVGISLDVERAKLAAELARLEAAFPVDCSEKEWKGPAARELGLEQIPVAWLLDPKGTIVEMRRGPLPPAFDEAVEKALRAVLLHRPARGRRPPLSAGSLGTLGRENRRYHPAPS
jgi:hypothetical protein